MAKHQKDNCDHSPILLYWIVVANDCDHIAQSWPDFLTLPNVEGPCCQLLIMTVSDVNKIKGGRERLIRHGLTLLQVDVVLRVGGEIGERYRPAVLGGSAR